MAKLNLSESIQIKKSYSQVHKYIINLHKWSEWSPWILYDKEAKVNVYKENNKDVMQWDGQFVGSGKLILEEIKDNEIIFQLCFIKPMKSQAQTSFILEKNGNNITKVSWSMNSRLPLPLFFLKKMFKKIISNDYKRGLMLMKNMLEEGKHPFKLDFVNIPERVESFDFYGIKNEGFVYELAHKMSEDFRKTIEIFKKENATIFFGYCFYEKIKITKEWFSFYSGLSTKNTIQSKELINKKIPSHKAIKVVLTGNFEYIESAWAGIMTHARYLKVKKLKTIPPYEKYIKGPNETKNPKEYITEIYYPVK